MGNEEKLIKDDIEKTIELHFEAMKKIIELLDSFQLRLADIHIKNSEIALGLKALHDEALEEKPEQMKTDQFMHLSRYANHALVYGVDKVDCVDDIEKVTCPYCLERHKQDKGLSDDFNPIKKT